MIRIARFVFLASIALYVLILKTLPSNAAPNPIMFYALTMIAVGEVVAISIVRRILITRSEQILSAQPDDPKALSRWRSGYLGIYSASTGIAIYGLLLHVLGFTVSQVTPFFVGGFALILFFSPRRPVETR
jgi:hypothetical protein